MQPAMAAVSTEGNPALGRKDRWISAGCLGPERGLSGGLTDLRIPCDHVHSPGGLCWYQGAPLELREANATVTSTVTESTEGNLGLGLKDLLDTRIA